MTNHFKRTFVLLNRIHMEFFLLIVRFFAIITWIFMLYSRRSISIQHQIFLLFIIFVSDALDGVISRQGQNSEKKCTFRLLDSTVDKLGILFFLISLIDTGRIGHMTPLCIIIYNIIISFVAVYIKKLHKKQRLDYIQATLCSRFYAICVGIYCFVANNITIVDVGDKHVMWFFLGLGFLSLISHALKFKRIKGDRY